MASASPAPSLLVRLSSLARARAPSAHAVLLAAFCCTSAYYALRLLHFRRVAADYRRLTQRRPRLTAAELLQLLEELREGAQAAVDGVEAALRVAESTPDEQLQLQAAARAEVQAQLAQLEARVLRAHGLDAQGDDLEHALAYYSSRSGGQRKVPAAGSDAERAEEVAAAATRLKRVAGKYFLTRGKVLDVMRGSFEVQARVSAELVEQLVQQGRARSLPELQQHMQGPAMERRLNDELMRYSLAETGMSVMEIDAVTNRPDWRGDAAFLEALSIVTNEGQEVLGRAQQRIAAMVQGGGDGVGGMEDEEGDEGED